MAEVRLALGLIFDANKDAVLLKRRDPPQLQLPGGRIEEGEVAAGTLIREVNSKLSIGVTALHHVNAGVFIHRQHDYLYELFQITAYEGVLQVPDDQKAVYEGYEVHNILSRRTLVREQLSPVLHDVIEAMRLGSDMHLR